MKHPNRKPLTMPQPPRYETRADLDGAIDVIGTGHFLDQEIDAAKFYAARTGGRKVWIIDLLTGRTVHRIERAQEQVRKAGSK